ncbi:hypothetical protein J6590_011664 [Homalodisca vitripennis]|nr:hypothetical protein J6590_011664 [Homalodisca vitripennis]
MATEYNNIESSVPNSSSSGYRVLPVAEVSWKRSNWHAVCFSHLLRPHPQTCPFPPSDICPFHKGACAPATFKRSLSLADSKGANKTGRPMSMGQTLSLSWRADHSNDTSSLFFNVPIFKVLVP